MRVVASEYAFDAPRQVQAGVVHIQLLNHGTDVHESLIVRFSGTAGSAGAYVDSVRADVDFPAFAVDLGGPGLTAAGDSTEVWLELAPGRYALVCWKGDHLQRGMARDLEVIGRTEAGRSRPPAADLVLGLIEYGYVLDGPLTAGRHVIRIENRGKQPHEADIFRLAPGLAVRDYVAWLDNGEHGESPVRPVGGVGDLAPGHEMWLAVSLTPGRYFIICQVPDAHDGQPHHRHGMVREFAVQ
jgi:uncharacterized cupredoxin-like copper-binding protein